MPFKSTIGNISIKMREHRKKEIEVHVGQPKL